MTIAQVKSKLGLISLDFAQCFDENDVATAWIRHWSNEERIAVVMKQETADLIKENRDRSDLSLWYETTVSEDKTVLNEKTGEMEKVPGREYLNCVIHIQENHVASF